MSERELQAKIGLLRMLRALGLQEANGISKLIADLIIFSMVRTHDQTD